MKSKVPQATISRLESTPRVQPRITILSMLAKTLGVDPMTISFGPTKGAIKAKAPDKPNETPAPSI